MPQDVAPELIKKSRRQKNIPDDWEWTHCAADCGEIVWHSGKQKAVADAEGVAFLLVCSTACSTRLFSLKRRGNS